MLRHVHFDKSAMGITQRSLKNLRDELAFRLNHRVVVFEMPTDDECCGFLIFDKESNAVAYTGDGFRLDRAGEGGAGYVTAQWLMRLFGVYPPRAAPVFDLEPAMELYRQGKEDEALQSLRVIFEQVTRLAVEEDFKRPRDRRPQYIRGVR